MFGQTKQRGREADDEREAERMVVGFKVRC